MGEVLVLLVAMIIGYTVRGSPAVPLIAIHILWINFVTDVFPALALGVDPPSPGIMARKPRNTKEHIITANMAWNIVVIGILMCVSALFLFNKFYQIDLVKAQTMVFTTLVVLEVVRIYMIRSQYHIGFFSNKYLLLAIISSISFQLVVVYCRLNKFF